MTSPDFLAFPDPADDPEYQLWVESMVQFCHCAGWNRPCEGVLAGGLCDEMMDDDLFNEGLQEHDDLDDYP